MLYIFPFFFVLIEQGSKMVYAIHNLIFAAPDSFRVSKEIRIWYIVKIILESPRNGFTHFQGLTSHNSSLLHFIALDS